MAVPCRAMHAAFVQITERKRAEQMQIGANSQLDGMHRVWHRLNQTVTRHTTAGVGPVIIWVENHATIIRFADESSRNPAGPMQSGVTAQFVRFGIQKG